RSRVPGCDLLREARRLAAQLLGAVGEPVLAERHRERAERRRLQHVDAHVEERRVHALDDVGPGDDEQLVAPFECRSAEVAGGDRWTVLPMMIGCRMWFSKFRYTTKKTTQATPTPAPCVSPNSTKGMPPTAPPICGTRSNTATHVPRSGARGTPTIRPKPVTEMPAMAATRTEPAKYW